MSYSAKYKYKIYTSARNKNTTHVLVYRIAGIFRGHKVFFADLACTAPCMYSMHSKYVTSFLPVKSCYTVVDSTHEYSVFNVCQGSNWPWFGFISKWEV